MSRNKRQNDIVVERTVLVAVVFMLFILILNAVTKKPVKHQVNKTELRFNK